MLQNDDNKAKESLSGHEQIKVVSIPASLFRNRALLLLFEQLAIPILAWRCRVDAVHSLHYTHPFFCPVPRIVTIHDLTFILYPELHTWGRRLVMPFFLKRAMRHAEALIFVSQATRDDAEKLIASGGNIRAVVPLAVNSRITIQATREAEKSSILSPIGSPFLLFLGTVEPRKNITRLVLAFEKIADKFSELQLVIAGKAGWHYEETMQAIASSRYLSRIHTLGFVTDSTKDILLGSCEMVIYPSLYEGFGLPVLEAMAAGAPVITGNISSLPEVAGDAALFIDPYSVDEMADAIENLMLDGSKRDALRDAGLRQAAKFTWRNTAKLTQQVYLNVFEKQSYV